jgi:pimeloyl-ACP methyl ester carboxylesterase
VDGTSTSGFETARVALRGGEVDVVRIEGHGAFAPLVFLHEGLGSIGLWRDFPESVARATRRGATVYSRFGYGRSDPWPGAREPDYMHREALEALPELLDALDVDEPVLVGHSDGASIALIYAGQSRRRVSALVLLAPHVFVEDESIAGIEAARKTFSTTDLRDRMAKHHDDADATFRQWNDIWRSPAFRDWNIEEVLPAIAVPILVIQGTADRYGTLAQVDAIERGVSGPVERVVLEGCGHSPHLERGPETLRAVTHFLT